MLNELTMTLRIKAEREQYEAEEVIHNRDLHRRILEAWRRDSPQMVARLEKQEILDDLAFVCQERMWQQSKAYRQGGMPVTDAREHLMLEPETPEEDDSDLPEGLQDGPKHLKDRWREEMRRLDDAKS